MLTIFPFGLLILGIVVSFFLKFTIKDAVREIPTEETTESNE